jgi:hypothetical protein
MTLRGSAFLALWNDFDPVRDDEYNCWHTFEHVPERVGIDGILAARRYVAMERSDHRYFTLYDLASLAALESPQYADVVDRPTAWSASMRPSFHNFLRRPCQLVASAGHGTGGSMATLRFSVEGPIESNAWTQVLERQLWEGGVIALHLGIVDVNAKFPVSNASSNDPKGTPLVMLVEGIDRKALAAHCSAIVETIRTTTAFAVEPEWKAYDLAFSIAEWELPVPKGQRQPERRQLRCRWLGE